MANSDIIDDREVLAEMARSEDDDGVLDEASEGIAADDAPAVAPVHYEINSYGADFPVESLLARLKRKDIFIPNFQRKFVWSQTDASRFIESLLLGFPVPAIFLYKERKNRHLVVDGQQRLISLERFYSGLFSERQFKLIGIGSKFAERTYRTLEEEDRRRLDDAVIHAIIVQQVDPAENEADVPSSIYLLFERLNSWGRPLFPQEIRACINHGPFIDLLEELNKIETWRDLYGPDSSRSKDQELILRFLALYFGDEEYVQPMKTYLDRFCTANRRLHKHSAEECTSLFKNVVEFIHKAITHSPFKPVKAFNAAIFDAVTVAVARRMARGTITDLAGARTAYESLLANGEFVNAYSSSTSRADQVKLRIEIATAAFADVA